MEQISLQTELTKYRLLWTSWNKRSLVDPVTGLPNKKAFLSDIKLEKERCMFHRNDLYSLIEIPIDYAFFDKMLNLVKKAVISTERLYRINEYSLILLTYHPRSERFEAMKKLVKENFLASLVRIKPVTTVRLYGSVS